MSLAPSSSSSHLSTPRSHRSRNGDDVSVVSRSTSGGSKGDHDYSYIQCSSPTLPKSLFSSSPPSSSGFSSNHSVATARAGNAQGRQQNEAPSSAAPAARSLVLQRCYGNADVTDRIGRTLSILLLTRFLVSFFLATMGGADEEM